ncbi:MAG: hypothetical protein H7A23_20780 [Leptospiraceae bacterium]|nr:hypothetical protein [Leptospiraceae bacterium]MCP5496997.1 hypothetical protein [Leptospiraceae bacterium]
MKSLLCILVISLSFHNCWNQETPEDRYAKKLSLLFFLDIYLWINVCPPKNATLTQGIHTITLNEGEEYWFNIKDVKPSFSFDIYDLGIAESSGQTISVGDPNCLKNQQITNPSSKAKAEGEKPMYYKDGFGIYRFILSGSDTDLVGIKSTLGSGEVKIKVPY